jgi:hypothetical protein
MLPLPLLRLLLFLFSLLHQIDLTTTVEQVAPSVESTVLSCTRAIKKGEVGRCTLGAVSMKQSLLETLAIKIAMVVVLRSVEIVIKGA